MRLRRALTTAVVLGMAALPLEASAEPTPTPGPSSSRPSSSPGTESPGTGQHAVPAVPAGYDETANDATGEGKPYPGDPAVEALYVADEDHRLLEVRTVDSLARWNKLSLNKPYRLGTGSAYTLVLTQRRDAYTIRDLLSLAPQTFVQQPDGGYLLSEHIVVQSGATLNLAASGGLKLRLASDADGFVSIVNYGGTLNIQGTKGRPVAIGSWNRDTDAADLLTNDGRAYLRSIGGQVRLKHVQLTDLGFWSGRTGGLALTGTDRPNSGALDELGKTMRVGKRAQRERENAEAANKKQTTAPSLNGKGKSTLSDLLPTGRLPVPEVSIEDPQYSYVSAAVQHTVVKRNAFGLFTASANGVDIRDSSFDDNLVDGLVMHRFVTNAVVESSTANGNAGDGIVLSRATTGIVLSEVEANRNQRNGLTMSGLPLANGPSATGSSVGSYGNNTVSNSRADHNGRYGVEVVGGTNVGVTANDLNGNDMGIVVRGDAADVSVVGNRVTEPQRQGIAVRDGVRDSVVSGNIVTGGRTSIYLRDATVSVKRNTLTDANMHAVTLIGNLGSTQVTENTISGRGPSAIDAKRADAVTMDRWQNDDDHWHDTTPFYVTLKKFLQPLTALWMALGALLLFTAARGVRRSRRITHPYVDKARVSDGVPVSVTISGAGR